MAEIKTWAEQCPNAGAIIISGPPAWISSTTWTPCASKALPVWGASRALSPLPRWRVGGYPLHGLHPHQPAEVTTVGHRLAQSAQDLAEDLAQLRATSESIRGKGMKGAVGTSASYRELLAGTGMTALQLEERVMDELGLPAYRAATQVYSRKQDLRVGQALSNMAATLHKLFFDFRILQSPPIGEWSEPFAAMQVGSSAMPFKRNPIHSEKIDSLCRYIEAQVSPLWYNCANNLLERTLDDSATVASSSPPSSWQAMRVLITAQKVIDGMQVHPGGLKNLDSYAIFAATERS